MVEIMDLNEILPEIEKASRQLIKDRAKEEVLIKEWEHDQGKLAKLVEYELDLLKVRALFQQAAEMTQKQLEFHISGLVSTALAAIWDNPYEFLIEFIQRRGKTEADLWLVRNGSKIKPIDASGGGVVDVVSLALRMAFWSLTKETRPLLILDEPFRNLSDNLQSKAADMLKMLSEKLGLQVLMISHIQKLVDCADKIFKVKFVKDQSYVN